MAETTPTAPTITPAPAASLSPALASAAPSVASPSPTPIAPTPAASASDGLVVRHEPAAPVVATTPAGKRAKPADLPDDIWDADAGDYKSERVKQLLELDTAERARRDGLPKSAAEYKPDLPAEVKLPEGASINTEDPVFKSFQAKAHAKGWTQEQFSDALGEYVKNDQANTAKISSAIKARDEALGPNGPARVDAITTFAKTIAPNDKVAGEIAKMLVTPGIIETFERIQTALGSQGIAALSRAPVAPAPDPSKIEGWDSMTAKQQIAIALQRSSAARASR